MTMLVRLRVRVPDRPGSLGRVASTLGAIGADIAQVEVLESGSGRAIDEISVNVNDLGHLDLVRHELSRVPGVSVVGVQLHPPAPNGHNELKLVAQVLARPSRALLTLVDGAPGAISADWAAILLYGPAGPPPRVVATSVRAPDPEHIVVTAALRNGTVRIPRPDASGDYDSAALVAIGSSGYGLLIVREEGPGFHRAELARLAEVGDIVQHVVPVAALA